MDLRRHPRQPIRAPARILTDAGWNDAFVLDVSISGLRFATTNRLKRGAFVEVRRGGYVIIAQVMWARDGHVGAMSQDTISARHLLKERAVDRPKGTTVERRSVPRLESQTSKQAGALIDRCLVLLGIVFGCLATVTLAYEAIAVPITSINEALTR